MPILFILFSVLYFAPTNSNAAVQTETHTYITCPSDMLVLAIDRKTGEEISIQTGIKPKEIVIHGNFGYVVNQRSNTVSVIDLRSHTVTHTIPIGNCPLEIVIHNSFGYVTNLDSYTLSIINLKTNAITDTLEVGAWPTKPIIHEDFAFIVNYMSGSISVLDLKSNTIKCSISVNDKPNNMIISDGIGYVVSTLSKSVSIIDLKTLKLKTTIKFAYSPQEIVIHDGFGYVTFKQKNIVQVINLETQTVIETFNVGGSVQKIVFHEGYGYVPNSDSNSISVFDPKCLNVIITIPVGQYPTDIVIHDDIGYVLCGGPCIYLIDLKTNKVIHTMNNDSRMDLNFSDTHFYLNAKKFPLPKYWLRLFKQPYSGIEELPTDDNADLAFEDFERAALVGDNETAQKHFNIALKNANKKAFAVAFKAFSLGLWGAPKDDKMALGFSTNVDWDYYRNIEGNPLVFSFKFKD